MAEKRRATTFRTSKGTVVNVAAPSVYVSPAFISSEDVISPAELREELRIGSAYPTGRVLLKDDFEKGLGGWFGTEGNQPVWSDENSVDGIGSMKIICPEPYATQTTTVLKRVTAQPMGKYGLEAWWVYKAYNENDVQHLGFAWDIDGAGIRAWPEVRFVNYTAGALVRQWRYNAGTVTVKNFVAIPGGSALPKPPWNTDGKYSWNYVKMVIDTLNKRYDYLVVDGVKLDMSGLAMMTEPSPYGIEGLLNVMFRLAGVSGTNRCWAFIDDVTLTMEEP